MNRRLEAELLRKNRKPVAVEATRPKDKRWGRLSSPVEAEETMRRIRAQSLMTGWVVYKDGSRNAGTLTLSESETVLAYFGAVA